MDISSSALRRRVREGRPIDFLVPDAVGAYIEQRGALPVTSERARRADRRLRRRQKAHDIVELDLRSVVDYTDYFVICSGGSDRQVKAIHDAIHEGCKAERGLLPRRVEGLAQAQWVLMDYLDVIVHVFVPEVREFYALERLWGEVPARAVGAAAG